MGRGDVNHPKTVTKQGGFEGVIVTGVMGDWVVKGLMGLRVVVEDGHGGGPHAQTSRENIAAQPPVRSTVPTRTPRQVGSIIIILII